MFALFAVALLAKEPVIADWIVDAATVLTQNPKAPVATAFAVKDGRFLAVGATADVQKYAGPKTIRMSLAGKTVTPGFNDAHLHPSPLFEEDSENGNVALGPERVKTIPELIARLKKKAAATPKGMIINGFGFQDTKLGRFPTCQDLDQASTEHPIIIRHSSGHLAVANSLALKLGGVTRDTASPAGGTVGKDANGEPNGYLAESAQGLVRNVGVRPARPSDEETRAAYLTCFRQFAAKGITSAGVAGTDIRTIETWEAMAKSGTLPVRLNTMVSENGLATLVKRKSEVGLGDEMVHLGAVKMFHGNSLSGRTCWVSKPYIDKPDFYGVPPARSQEQLNAAVLSVVKAGFQPCIHSNGDREIDMVLKAFENAQREFPRPDARYRIEHCSVITPELLARIKKQNVVIVPHSYEWEHGDKEEAYGAWRWDYMHPNGSALKLGIPFAGHSDYPVSAADPMLRIQCMVTRLSAEGKVYGAKQRVSPAAALAAWTTGSAFAEFTESQKGQIKAGMLADFIVLDQNPLKVKPDTLRTVQVLQTFVGGKRVFNRATDHWATRSIPADPLSHSCPGEFDTHGWLVEADREEH